MFVFLSKKRKNAPEGDKEKRYTPYMVYREGLLEFLTGICLLFTKGIENWKLVENGIQIQ